MEIPWFMRSGAQAEKTMVSRCWASPWYDDGWDAVKPFAAKLGMNYRVLLGNDETAQLYGGVDALPTTF